MYQYINITPYILKGQYKIKKSILKKGCRMRTQRQLSLKSSDKLYFEYNQCNNSL